MIEFTYGVILMKKIAIIVASGKGTRMGLDIPKQFAEITVDYCEGLSEKKEVLTYTLEAFQEHDMIDEIYVVTLEEYRRHVVEQALNYGITKLKGIIKGGETVQESIRNGVFSLKDIASEDDIVIIHDGVRPLVDEDVLTDVVEICKEKGNAVTSLPYNEQIFVIDENDTKVTNQYINRDKLRRVSTPQAYNFDLIYNAYKEAFETEIGIYPPSYTNTMMIDLGYTLNFAKGSDKNIKLTTPPDIIPFKAYKKDDYEKGKIKVKSYEYK